MSIDLVVIMKFADIFDRQHFSMIRTVTQRDTSLDWGSELEGRIFEGGGATKTSREEIFLLGIKGMTGGTGLPVMPVPCVQGLGFLRSVTSTTACACAGRI